MDKIDKSLKRFLRDILSKMKEGKVMELIGFVLLCIGLMIFFFAKRIIRGKSKLEPEDEREMKLLTSGAVIAVKMSGIVVAAIGFIFLALGAAMR